MPAASSGWSAIALIASWFVAVIFTPYLGVKLLPAGLSRARRRPTRTRSTRPASTAALRRVVAVLRAPARRSPCSPTSAIFAASDRRLRPRAAAVLPALGAAGAVLPDAPARGHRHRRDRARPRAQAEGLLGDDPDIATYTTYIGQGSPRFWLGLNPQLPNEAFAEIVIVAKDVEARERIKARLEKAVDEGALAEARVRVDRFNFGPPVGFPVQFRVVGPDPHDGARHRRPRCATSMRAQPPTSSIRISTGTR